MLFDINNIIKWILQHPVQYPGLFQKSQIRTDRNILQIEPSQQLFIIYKALGEYIKEKLQMGKGVNLQKFGAFAFDITSDINKPKNHTNLDIDQQKQNLKDNRKKFHRLRPCFIPDDSLKQLLPRFAEKKEIEKPNSQHSVYQQGFQMGFCNALPIAKSCKLEQKLVQQSINVIFQAVKDLIVLQYDIILDFQFMQILFKNKDISYIYSNQLINHLNDHTFEDKAKMSATPTEKFWKQNTSQDWSKSTLSSMLSYPLNIQQTGNFSKTKQIAEASKDMSSSVSTQYKIYQ